LSPKFTFLQTFYKKFVSKRPPKLERLFCSKVIKQVIKKVKNMVAGLINWQADCILVNPYNNALKKDKTEVTQWKTLSKTGMIRATNRLSTL
jgi:hypothetical protein